MNNSEIRSGRHRGKEKSQRASPSNRATRRAQHIRMRLGGTANMFLPFPVKPKGMHWLTYQRLRREEAEVNAESWPPWLYK
jgi:hypothetical protein